MVATAVRWGSFLKELVVTRLLVKAVRVGVVPLPPSVPVAVLTCRLISRNALGRNLGPKGGQPYL